MHIKMQHHKMIYSIMNDVSTCINIVNVHMSVCLVLHEKSTSHHKSKHTNLIIFQNPFVYNSPILSNRPSPCPGESLFRFILNDIIFGPGTILLGPSALSPDLHMLDAGMGISSVVQNNATSFVHVSYVHALYI